MSRLPIRARLTAVFAVAMVLVLAGAAWFVYARLLADLNDTVDTTLEARASAPGGIIEDPEEAFVQVVGRDGQVLDAVGGAKQPVLRDDELKRAARGVVVAERRVAGLEGQARIRARPSEDGQVVVAGQSLNDRDEALNGLLASFAIGGPVAVLLASLLGYALASAGLRPVEAMRRRAAEVSLAGEPERLPVPEARDEVRRLGETLNAMLDRLRESFDRERRFVADASHELRTPIAVIKTEVETALRQPDVPAEVRESLEAAEAEADHLARLAEDLLVLARAAEGRLPVHAERLEARAVLGRARERLADRAGRTGRTIRVDAPAGLWLAGDPMRLAQALGNLVDNALRHGTGEIVMAARAAEGGGVEIDVTDQGMGFPAGFEASAFERFTRGDEARTGDGAGLGLAIVKAIAEAHGGSVSIDGASVRIFLPPVSG